VAIFVNATTYLLVIAVLLILRPRETATLAPEVRVLRAVGEGARFVWQNLPLRTAVVAAFLSAACGQSMQSQAAAISRRVFDRSSKDSAWLLTALGAGALLSFVGWTVLGERLRRSRQILLGQVGFAVSAVVIASTSSFAIGLLGYAIGGFSHLTNSVGINTLIQGEIPDAMRGRMMSFYLMGIIGGIPVGAYALGWFGDAFGMRWALLGNAGALLAALWWLWARGWLGSMDVTTMSGHRVAGSNAAAR
jgi:MFS family permease